MKMIIGGAFQGKSHLAEAKYPEIQWVKGTEAGLEEIMKAEGVIGFHEFIRTEMKKGNDVSRLAEMLIERNPNVVLVSDEVGYGVVPLDAFDREYREKVGRICTKLAAYSSSVIRVVCGIGTVIKDA